MMLTIQRIGVRGALKLLLLAQLLIGGLLVSVDLLENIPLVLPERVELPSGPVSPGDQRRTYRTDRTDPALLNPDGAPDLAKPELFTERLTFLDGEMDGYDDALILSGTIDEGDAERFRLHLAEMSKQPEVILLNSPGGLVHEAQDIGRELRNRNMSSAVLAGSYCMSSCPYILAGGVERVVSVKAAVGVHQHYYQQPKYLPVFLAVEHIQYGQGDTMEYLIEMGVDPALMVHSLNTPPDQIYAFVESELTETQLATKIIN